VILRFDALLKTSSLAFFQKHHYLVKNPFHQCYPRLSAEAGFILKLYNKIGTLL
jgi:hypothetical protein